VAVHTNEPTLNEILQKILFEQEENVTAGAFANIGSDDDIPEEDLTPPLPLEPTEQMATQLSVERPPVEDEDYIPVSSKELSRASATLAKSVPTEEVEKFYNRLKELVGDAMAPSDEGDMDAGITDEVNEQSIPDASIDTLDQIAGEFGYSGASGARQAIERILGRLGYMAENIDIAELDTLRQDVAKDFADTLISLGLVDEEDAGDLLSNPEAVSSLPSFRYYFSAAVLLPVHRKLIREAEGRVKEMLADVGLPQKTVQTVMNQVFKRTPRNTAKLLKKLEKDAVGMSVEQVKNMKSELIQLFPKLSAIAGLQGDFIIRAREHYDRLSRSRKSAMASQALERLGE